MSSVDPLECVPLTGATTVDDSPCMNDASPVLHLSLPSGNRLSPLSIDPAQSPRPPRKRESGIFQLQSMSVYGSIHRSQSLSMMSEGWMCSNEDLEPEVRDCVSSLSGRKNQGRRDVNNVDWTSIGEEQRSIDSVATTILSSRGIAPGSAPLLQQCSSTDRLR